MNLSFCITSVTFSLSKMYKIREDEMVICPYNRYHVVSKLRIQKHIFKCKKNNLNVKLATCFYNYSHKIKPEDMLAHYEICSHKNRLEGSRYYEPPSYVSADSSIKSDSQNFPDINVKTRFFPNMSNLQKSCEDGSKFSSLSSDFEDSQTKNVETSDESDGSESDLEPLPLPKTISKAFVCEEQQPKDFESLGQTFQSREFGRGKYFLTSKPSITTNHTVNTTQNDMSGKKSSKIFSDIMNHCSESVMSSMFDDATTLNSEEIIFDDDDDLSSLKSFDKCIKL